MTPEEFQQRVARGDLLALLDVREEHERATARIMLPATVTDLFVPLGQVADRKDEIQSAAAGRPLVVVCHHGARSQTAAVWLDRQGVPDVHNLDGGIDAWSVRVDRDVPRY